MQLQIETGPLPRYETVAAISRNQTCARVISTNHIQAMTKAREMAKEYKKNSVYIECHTCLGVNYLNPDGTHTPRPKAAW